MLIGTCQHDTAMVLEQTALTKHGTRVCCTARSELNHW